MLRRSAAQCGVPATERRAGRLGVVRSREGIRRKPVGDIETFDDEMSKSPRSDVRVGRPEESVRAVGARVLSVLGRQSWLDRPGYRLEHTLGFALAACGGAGERTSNLLHGTWLGHPLHPLVVALPTGAVATTVALDVAAVLPGHQAGLREASRVSLGSGIVASLAAATTGLNDWQQTQEQSRRVGLVHGALNAVATALYVLSWCDRRRGRHVRGVAASAVGYGITAASGYLGASLVYRLGVGVDQSGVRWDTGEWTLLLAEAALEAGQPQRVEAAGVGLVLLRDGDDVLAVGELCPHLGAPIVDGWMDRGQLVCPWHGSRFDPVTGQVVRGPATAPLPCYQTRILAGTIEVRPGKPTGLRAATGAGE